MWDRGSILIHSRGKIIMAAKDAKVPRYQFQIPSAEEVDQPVAGLKKGSVFSLLKRPANSEDSQDTSAARGEIKVSSIEPHLSNPTSANAKTTDLPQKIKEKDSFLSNTENAKGKNNDGKIEVTEPTAVDNQNDVAVEKEETVVEKLVSFLLKIYVEIKFYIQILLILMKINNQFASLYYLFTESLRSKDQFYVK